MPVFDQTPNVILMDSTETLLEVSSGVAVPVGTKGILVAGIQSNGTGSFLSLDSANRLLVTGSFTVPNTVTVTGSVGISGIPTVTGSITVANTVTITGSVGIANFPVTQSVTGSIGISGVPTITGSVTVANTVTITGSVGITNFPVTQSVTGSIGISGIPTVTGSVSVLNTVLITGSVGITNFPVTQSITGSVGISGIPTVTGSVSVLNTVLITGSIGITNFPVTQSVTGSVGISGTPTVTGSVSVLNVVTVTGSVAATVVDVTVAGTGSAAPCSGSMVGGKDTSNNFQPFAVTTGGVLFISGTVTGSVGITNFPVTQSVTGSVGISGIPTVTGSITVPNTVTVTGSVGITNFPVTQSVTGSVGISGTPTVTGSVSVLNVVTVTGSFSATVVDVTVAGTGSAAPSSGSMVGGKDTSNNFQPFAVTTGGVLFISGTITGSVGITNFPVTQSVTGSVGISGIPTVTGSITVANTVTVTGSVGITNFPVTQSVTGSVGISGIPTVTGSITVPNTVTITGSVGITNFPVTQSVTGSVGISGIPTVTGSVSVLNVVTVTGSLAATFTDPAEGTPGSAAPSKAIMVGGSDGTNLRTIKTDQTGRLLLSTSGSNMLLFDSNNKGVRSTVAQELKVASLWILADLTMKYEIDARTFDMLSSSGGTIVHVPAQSCANLAVTTASGSTATLRTNTFYKYQAGYTQLVAMSIINPDTGITNQVREWGYFDESDGLFWRLSGTTMFLVERSSVSGTPVDTTIQQNAWNADKLDGSGSSGLLLDISKCQLCEMEVQWFGVGTVRYFIDGILIHESSHANVTTAPYMRTATLPVQVRISNSAITTTGSIKIVCARVAAQGGTSDPISYNYGAHNETDRLLTTTETAIISIRPKLTYNSITNRSWISPKRIWVSAEDNKISYHLLWGSVLSGAVWVSPTSTSAVEYDISSTSFVQGEHLLRGFLAVNNSVAAIDVSNLFGYQKRFLRLSGFAGSGSNVAQDVITIMAKNEGGGKTRCNVSIEWEEIR